MPTILISPIYQTDCKMAPRQPRRKGWVDWKKTKAKKIIMEDLENEVLPSSEEEMSAVECWKIYKQYPEFKGIKFDQFEARLADHREAVDKSKNESFYDEESFRRDRMIRPVKTRNQRGELKFHLSPAYKILLDDVKSNKHKRLTPLCLWYSNTEYQRFDKDKFRQRIYQMERKVKFVFMLELKRTEKKKKFKNAQRAAGMDPDDDEDEEE